MSDRPNSIPWPPIFYGGAILFGFLLQKIMPMPWLPYTLGQFFFMFGLIAIITGLAIDIKAIQTLWKRKTTVSPIKPATHLITEGAYSLSRNPIYLGNSILTFGLGFAFGNLWLFATCLIAIFFTNHFVILREERHLKAKFGSAWQKYSKRVRRWI